MRDAQAFDEVMQGRRHASVGQSRAFARALTADSLRYRTMKGAQPATLGCREAGGGDNRYGEDAEVVGMVVYLTRLYRH